MTHLLRSILAVAIVATVLAACGTTADAAPSEPASPQTDPSAQPSVAPSEAPVEPSAPANEERDVDGTITLYPGTASGPGGSIQEALGNGPDGDLPSLVNGVLFRDTDGRIFLATSVSDTGTPTFDGPMLEVLEYPNEGPMWDMANAEMLGLQEANGVVFQVDAQILGIVRAS